MFHAPEISFIGFDYLDAPEIERMKRSLELLYSTAAGTCPGDRNFGLDQSFESCPVNVAQNLFALEIIEKTEIYEKKAEVQDIFYEQAADGNLTPCIVIGQKEPDGMDDGEDDEEF